MPNVEAYALDLRALYKELHPKLRGKFALVWRLGAVKLPADRPDQSPHSRLAMADVLFDGKPTLADLKRKTLRVQTNSYRTPPETAILFVQDGPLPRGVTALGEVAAPPKHADYRCFGYWEAFALYCHLQWRHD